MAISPDEERSEELNEVFKSLATPEKRQALYVMRHLEEVDLDDLVANLQLPSGKSYDQMRTSIAHVHMPQLEGAGLLEYERDSDTVRYLGPGEELEGLFDELLKESYEFEFGQGYEFDDAEDDLE